VEKWSFGQRYFLYEYELQKKMPRFPHEKVLRNIQQIPVTTLDFLSMFVSEPKDPHKSQC
jgi:hypothetical protein